MNIECFIELLPLLRIFFFFFFQWNDFLTEHLTLATVCKIY